MPDTSPTPSKYDRLIAGARDGTPAVTIVAHPCDETSLRGAIDAAAEQLIEPVLVGPEAKIRSVAAEHGIDLTGRKIVDAAHSQDAAACAVALIREGKGELLMKGSLHTDELMREVTASATGLRTERQDQPRLRHGRAGPPGDAVHHRRGDQHLPRSRREARHRPERHRPLGRHRDGHAAGRHPFGRRDGDDEDSLDHRGSGALQDGRPRADHRRPARRPARLRQRHRPRGGADQGHHLASRRAARRSSSSPTSRRATCWRRT